VAAIRGRMVCADIFDSPALMGKLWRKLVESYALDAMEPGLAGKGASPRPAAPRQEEASVFLQLAAVSEVEPFDAPGIGRSLRLKAGEAAGSALVLDQAVVHLELFPPEAAGAEPGSPFARSRLSRPSERRRPH